MDSTRAVADEVFDLTVGTSPPVGGDTVQVTTIHGIDGEDVGFDEDGEDLAFPVTCIEGLGGVYSTRVMLPEGLYFAVFTFSSGRVARTVVRVMPDGWPDADAQVNVAYTVAAIFAPEPTSVSLTLGDRSGDAVGNDDLGDAISWPQAMVQVPTYEKEWYYGPVYFEEGAKIQASITPSDGPAHTASILVHAPPEAGTLAHLQGWEPDSALIPDDWIPLSYIRRWTGWSSGSVPASDVRELRRTAIDTFIDQTNAWVPGWVGTWHGLRGQGRVLFLPVNIVLPSNGGIEPVVTCVSPEGDQEEFSVVDNAELVWRVGGRNSRQPYLELRWASWDPCLDVKIRATWGLQDARIGNTKLRQVIVGLCRWHSLSFGVDAEEARDQATLNHVRSEGSRDQRVEYGDTAVSVGITGDRVVDRALYEFRVEPGPWVSRTGGETPPAVDPIALSLLPPDTEV